MPSATPPCICLVNCSLHAAAPDLLAALRDAQVAMRSLVVDGTAPISKRPGAPTHREAYVAVVSAIAKASGH